MNTIDIKKWVEENIRSVNTLADIAEHFDISVETLRKQFRRKEQKNLHTFIVETRVRKAQQLLKENPRLKCFEICFEVGFEREDTGAKTFKKITGMTMEAYRELHSNHK